MLKPHERRSGKRGDADSIRDGCSSLAARFAQDRWREKAHCARRDRGYTPAEGRRILQSICHMTAVEEQEGAGLGARLEAAIGRAAALCFSPLIVTGTDSPTLPPGLIETDINSLVSGEVDLVLGPTEDGGYYLVGLNRPVSHIFKNVAWSTQLYTSRRPLMRARWVWSSGASRWYDWTRPPTGCASATNSTPIKRAGARTGHLSWLLAHEWLPPASSDRAPGLLQSVIVVRLCCARFDGSLHRSSPFALCIIQNIRVANGASSGRRSRGGHVGLAQ